MGSMKNGQVNPRRQQQPGAAYAKGGKIPAAKAAPKAAPAPKAARPPRPMFAPSAPAPDAGPPMGGPPGMKRGGKC